MRHETLAIAQGDGVCRIRLDRAAAGNALNARMVDELSAAIQETQASVLVIEGAREVFCSGGDLEAAAGGAALDPASLYDLWTRLATGPFVSIALVRGRANAGGVGLACACDLVLADRTATFALSELLFGLYPACVMPFLVRRIGVQKAHQMALLTRPVAADDAAKWGIADAVGDDAEALLRGYLPRLAKLSPVAVGRYKSYMADLADTLSRARPSALAANREMFADPDVVRNIQRYATEMKFPWET